MVMNVYDEPEMVLSRVTSLRKDKTNLRVFRCVNSTEIYLKRLCIAINTIKRRKHEKDIPFRFALNK